MATWQHGNMATWQHGNMATWQHGNMATWQHGNVKCKNKSFTLVEIVFTLAIIGILLAIFLPATSAIKLSAQKVKDQSNLRTIAAAWRECAINRGWTFAAEAIGVTIFVEQLAGRGRTSVADMVLNDANVYISPGDKYASKLKYEALTRLDNTQKITYTSAFASTSNFMSSGERDAQRISYCLIANLPSNAPLDTTPFAFTRGLREDGKWDEKSGLYGSKGGYVVFCDGHTTWFDGSKPAKFLHWNGKEYTSDIRNAVPSSTFIMCGNGGTKTNYTSDGQLVLLYHAGTGGE
jgi:type II secretory pathway pseudopilin PulG